MNSKLKKVSIALAGIMSAVAIAGVVPMGTVGTLGSVATVAHAVNNLSDDIDSDTVFNGDVTVPAKFIETWIGSNKKCVVTINGNLTLANSFWDDWWEETMIGDLRVAKGSIIIVNGNVTLGSDSSIIFYDNSIIFATGTVTNNGGTLEDGQIVKPTLQNIAYVAETDDHYAYFTSDSKLYTLNGNVFVETTEAAVSKSKPATATYAQVGTDYPAEFSSDRQASLWKVTVTPGTDTIETLSVKVNGNEPDNPLSDTTQFSGKSAIVFGVVLNGIATDVQTFKALVNGAEVTTTLE